MNNCTMDQYTLQSYFKSLCNSFYIAYKQVKRLEGQQEKLDRESPKEELKIVGQLLKISATEEIQEKYISKKYSQKQLKEKKEMLEISMNEYEKKTKELEISEEYWLKKLWDNVHEIKKILSTMQEKGFTIIVTSKEEVLAFMALFEEKSMKKYRVINIEEQYLKSFPADGKMYEEFFAAYCLEDESQMQKVIQKYF